MVYFIAGLLSTQKNMESTHPEDHVEFAENLLYTLEIDCGMSPPTTHYLAPDGIIYNAKVWEPEDED